MTHIRGQCGSSGPVRFSGHPWTQAALGEQDRGRGGPASLLACSLVTHVNRAGGFVDKLRPVCFQRHFLCPLAKGSLQTRIPAHQQAGVCVKTRTRAYVFITEFVNGSLKLKIEMSHGSTMADLSMLGGLLQGAEPWQRLSLPS